MIIFINGQFLPEEQAAVSVLDRGFLYGDGLFETLRVVDGEPQQWAEHFARLQRGAAYLRLRVPFQDEQLMALALDLIQRNAMPDSVLRVNLTRGVGARGYSPAGANASTVVMTLHPTPLPPGAPTPHWNAIISSQRIDASDPLCQFKTNNKLKQILARMEADDAGANESLLLNTTGHLVEGSASNLFWVRNNVVFTPALCAGALPGITRAGVIKACERIGVSLREVCVEAQELLAADGAFVTLSTLGIVPLQSVGQTRFGHVALVEMLIREIRE